MNWLDEITNQHDELESPKSFWYWSALASVSAVLKDSVWLDKFLYKLYPNIYVMLHADSGIKKGPPISMAKQLVREVDNTRIYAGRSSVQGILKDLGTAETKPGGHILKKSVGFICSSELTSSIVEDKVALTILTDLYDRQYNIGDWRSLLKMEIFSLTDPTLTMLTATNEAHGAEFFVRRDIQGGYFARTFIIYEWQRNTINSLMFPLKTEIDYKKSAIYLKEISLLKGEVTMNFEARTYFDEWYKKFRYDVDEQKLKDPTGTLNRFDDSVLKVALLISLARAPVLEITLASVKEAIEKCERLVGNVRRTTLARGRSQWVQEKALAIEELITRDNHIITRQQLNMKYWMHANVGEWDEIMKSLEVAGAIVIEMQGNQVCYRMPVDEVEKWKKHFKGK